MNKLEKLENFLKKFKKVAVAYSGGVDSTFLLYVAHNILKENAIAITINSCLCPKREQKETKNFCIKNNIKQNFIEIDPFKIKNFKNNPKNRCYICKCNLFSKIIENAKKNNIKNILDGTNFDDTKDYRPGLKALEELNIISPLKIFEFTKQEIRDFSKKLKLYTWNKSSFSCLATRFPFNEEFNKEKLKMVEEAEDLLYNLKFKQFRVRNRNSIASIEVESNDLKKIINHKSKIIEKFKKIGFNHITLDLEGYKTGNMNK